MHLHPLALQQRLVQVFNQQPYLPTLLSHSYSCLCLHIHTLCLRGTRTKTLFQGAQWTESTLDPLHHRSRKEAPPATDLARPRQVPDPSSSPLLGPSVAVRTMAALPKRIVKETERLMAEP